MMLLQTGILCILLYLLPGSDSQSRCSTPNGDTGRCISIYSCSNLLSVVRTKDSQQLQFLKESQCGYQSNPLVCCGRYNNYQQEPSTSNYDRWGSDSSSESTNRRNNNNIPDRSRCGRQSSDKILGGETTGLDEFPWMALLQYRKRNGGGLTFSCGGTLISPKYVLTAAHCVKGQILTKVGSLVSVRLGEWDTTTEQDCISQLGFEICNDPVVDIGVEEAFAHSGYSDTNANRYDDIALVRLRRNAPYSNFIRPICLPLNDHSELGDSLTVSGWGKTEYSNSSPKKLKLRVPLAASSQCAQRFRTAGVNIGNKQLCAGGQSQKDSCNGDSGGPLMTTFKNDTSQWYIEGVVSFGARCGSQGWPGIYTKVSEYVNWIENSIRA